MTHLLGHRQALLPPLHRQRQRKMDALQLINLSHPSPGLTTTSYARHLCKAHTPLNSTKKTMAKCRSRTASHAATTTCTAARQTTISSQVNVRISRTQRSSVRTRTRTRRIEMPTLLQSFGLIRVGRISRVRSAHLAWWRTRICLAVLIRSTASLMWVHAFGLYLSILTALCAARRLPARVQLAICRRPNSGGLHDCKTRPIFDDLTNPKASPCRRIQEDGRLTSAFHI